MNIYMLVEGKKTEEKVYPKFLEYFLPQLTRVDSYDGVEENNYFLFNANGYPSILDDLQNAIDEINEIGKYDYLLVCIDTDDSSVTDLVQEVNGSITRKLETCELKVIAQRRCFETWFLGNQKVVKRNPTTKFKDFLDYYDVRTLDPEEMLKMTSFKKSNSQFHSEYLRKMLFERGITYSKRDPKNVCSQTYISELEKRVDTTEDLNSLKTFIELIREFKVKFEETQNSA